MVKWFTFLEGGSKDVSNKLSNLALAETEWISIKKDI